MNIYTVRLSASHESTDYIGYHQNYDALDENGQWVGGVGKDASCFAHKAQVEGSEAYCVVTERAVMAPTPYAACRKLEHWITKMRDNAEWLMSEEHPK